MRGRGLVWLMAAGCGVSVANVYYNQPLLAQMGGAFLPVWTQVGVGIGMFLFVPLGDMFERRGLIVKLSCATALAAALTALAPNLALLSVASLLLGLTSIVPHLILPYAAQISAPAERGRVVGAVLGGLLIGILAARTVSGFVGSALGWRSVYWMAAVLMLVLAVTLGARLPISEPSSKMTYRELLRSLGTLVREQPLLREASLIGGLLFGAFSVFWATLVYRLSQPPLHFGAEVAGLFGLVGLAGAVAATAVGRLADRNGPRYTVGVGIWVTAVSFGVFWIAGTTIVGLVAGVVLLDLGVQAGHVSNQTRVYSLVPEARSRLNTVYMVTYFAGGSMGSALGAFGWRAAGWNGVCASGLALSVLALAAHLIWKSDG